MNNIQFKNYDSLDLLKFIMSIMIVAIHTRFLKDITFPWLRIAVPVFFIISSYLFFLKISTLNSDCGKKAKLYGFVKRNLQLYMFYFVLFFPITIYLMRAIFAESIIVGIITLLRNFFFSSTFRASWFIMANIIGVVFVFLLSRKLSNVTVLIITFVINIFVVLRSAYFGIIEPQTQLFNAIMAYENIFTYCFNSFPAALLWVAIGKCFADETIKLNTRKAQLGFMVLGSALLFAEYTLTKTYFNANGTEDCYFSLIIICPAVFAFFRDMNFDIPNAKFLRTLSTMIYAIHSTVIFVVRLFLSPLDLVRSPYEFYISFTATLLFALFLLLLEKKTNLKVLKYSH